MNLWNIWEWDITEDNDALIPEGGKNIIFDEISSVVEKEIRRNHSDVGEECISYENFVREEDNSIAKNIIYNLPSKQTELNTFRLMRMCNGSKIFGLTAWRVGCHPDELSEKF